MKMSRHVYAPQSFAEQHNSSPVKFGLFSNSSVWGVLNDEEKDLWVQLQEKGLKQALKGQSDYAGYTGPKNKVFPTSINLPTDQYPDITEDFEAFRKKILTALAERGKEPSVLKGGLPLLERLRELRLFSRYFSTAHNWDTKFNPAFPGRNKKGQTQYALYKGKIVSANYLSNNAFGYVLTKRKYPSWLLRVAADLDAIGAAKVFNGKIPTRSQLSYTDTPEDKKAIRSGRNEALHGNPWKDKTTDPRRPY